MSFCALCCCWGCLCHYRIVSFYFRYRISFVSIHSVHSFVRFICYTGTGINIWWLYAIIIRVSCWTILRVSDDMLSVIQNVCMLSAFFSFLFFFVVYLSFSACRIFFFFFIIFFFLLLCDIFSSEKCSHTFIHLRHWSEYFLIQIFRNFSLFFFCSVVLFIFLDYVCVCLCSLTVKRLSKCQHDCFAYNFIFTYLLCWIRKHHQMIWLLLSNVITSPLFFFFLFLCLPKPFPNESIVKQITEKSVDIDNRMLFQIVHGWISIE